MSDQNFPASPSSVSSVSSATSIDLVVFDLGRVLVRLCDGWGHACVVAHVPVPTAADDPAMTRRIVEASNQHEHGRIDTPGFCRRVAEFTGMTADHVLAVTDVWLRGPFPGVRELIDELADAHVPTACLSNTNEHHWRQMVAPGGPNNLPLHRLSYRFASHLLGMMKPDPRIYEHVERAVGLAPERILFFDDHAPNIAAALERGWRAVQVPRCHDTTPFLRHQLAAAGVLPTNSQ